MRAMTHPEAGHVGTLVYRIRGCLFLGKNSSPQSLQIDVHFFFPQPYGAGYSRNEWNEGDYGCEDTLVAHPLAAGDVVLAPGN